MKNKPKILLISGAPGVGKTTVIKNALRGHRNAVHIPVDKIRAFVKQGYASPDNWSEETEFQYSTARKAAAFLAREYSKKNYLIFIDDVFRNSWKEEFEHLLEHVKYLKIYLREDISLIQERNRKRAHVVDPRIVENFYNILESENNEMNGWYVINNKSLKNTVELINRLT